jgi:phosphoribosylglycinamide formyltransferase-1
MPTVSASLDVVVLASGRGSNLRAIFAACDAGTCCARVVAVVSDKPDAPALALARERGVAAVVVELRGKGDRAAWDERLASAIAQFSPALVVLAGFMRIVGPAVLARFPYGLVNVHPALLPSFKGSDGPAQAIAAGVRISGCTVHLVDAGVDTGPVLAQAAVRVEPGDDAASLHARIQRAERILLPAVVDAIARGTLVLGATPRHAAAPAEADAPLAALYAPPLR